MNISKRPLILVTNDDGITSSGIRVLVELMSELGEVVVVAPNSPQSGMGHAITMGEPLRLYKTDIFEGVDEWECSGTPVDCIKLAKHHVLKNRKIDLLVSGINHGSNSSINVLYSGTMSAAIEGAVVGIPAIGFSLCDFREDAHFDHARDAVSRIVRQALQNGIPKSTALNVNIPAFKGKPLKGIRVCRQADAKWDESFEQRQDPHGRNYFWMSGQFVNLDEEKGSTDEWALENGYISIVPCQFDLTSHRAIASISQWEL